MSAAIISAPLAKPPRGANRLSSKGDLLIIWRRFGYVAGEDGAEYHFAMHSPAWGWRGYRWNEKYGEPMQILPVTQDAVWVHTEPYHLIHLQIKENSNLAITNPGVKVRNLFHADARGGLLVGKVVSRMVKTERWQFDKINGGLSKIALYDTFGPSWGHFLSDGTIAIYDCDRLIVLSPEGGTLHEENVAYCCYPPPFIARYDDDHLYYTDDPRNGWCRSEALKVIQQRIGKNTTIESLNILNNNCYIALADTLHNIHLYRFSSDYVEYVWEITSDMWLPYVAPHSGLICITSPSRILSYGSTDIPKNNGFLAWDPITNTFYDDIPRRINVRKISTGKIPTINIPSIWSKNAQQR